jgi:hypothetical protein
MTQNTKLKQMPTKSGEWLEAECLKLARRTSAAAKSSTSQSDDCTATASFTASGSALSALIMIAETPSAAAARPQGLDFVRSVH